MKICGYRVILAYSNDGVVMEETRDEIINTTFKTLRTSKAIVLRMNADKTNYLMAARIIPNIDYVTVDNYKFGKVDGFRYLGVNINNETTFT